jgi:hypothetical protein
MYNLLTFVLLAVLAGSPACQGGQPYPYIPCSLLFKEE